MATESVMEPVPADEASYINNDEMRGLSLLLGSKDVEQHAIGLPRAIRERLGNYCSSASEAQVTHIQTLAKLLSGYDEQYAPMPTLYIGWILQELAHRAEAYREIADACEYANRNEVRP